MTLRVAGLTAGYGQLEILQDIGIEVPPRQIVGIIGPNGAGKSTLLKAVFGYVHPFSGVVTFEGQDLVRLRPDQILRHGIGFVAQTASLFAEMTVAENLALGSYSLGPRAAARMAVEAVYEEFPLFRERRRQLAGSLSGGEQRILAIARALIVRPRLILLDEPSAALSPRLIEVVYDTIRVLPERGVGVLIVEQNVEKILDVAQRVFVLDLGRNAFDGTPAELRRSDRIRRLYLGEAADA